MSLILNNTTGNNLSYNFSGISVNANSSYTVPQNIQIHACNDQNIKADVGIGNVTVGDGTNTYLKNVALQFMAFKLSVMLGVMEYIPSISGLESSAQIRLRGNQFGALHVSGRWSYTNITGNTTKVVKNASGTLHAVMLNNASTNGTVTIYDNTAASGTKIGTLTIGSPSGGLLSASGIPNPQLLGELDTEFSTGLTVVTAGSTGNDITVFWL